MVCKGCIARQRKLVEFFCRKGEGSMCQKVRARLAKMVGPEESAPAQTYQNRMLTSETVKTDDQAPYGYKLDGTPRARPGRQAKAE